MSLPHVGVTNQSKAAPAVATSDFVSKVPQPLPALVPWKRSQREEELYSPVDWRYSSVSPSRDEPFHWARKYETMSTDGDDVSHSMSHSTFRSKYTIALHYYVHTN